MTRINILNFVVLCLATSVSAAQYYEISKFLPRDQAIERANGNEPIIIVNSNKVSLDDILHSHYDYKSFFSPLEISRFTIEYGPEGFGCFIGSGEEPYRSHFITRNRALEETVPRADYVHCYALEFPTRDVLLDAVSMEGMRSSIFVNAERGFRSLSVPISNSYISSIALVEEADVGLSCRIDLSNGEQLLITRENPELTNLTGLKFIGCRFNDNNIRFGSPI